MENKDATLVENWKFYECANDMARFGILMDFVKQSTNQLYQAKSKQEKLDENDIIIFKSKYDELKSLLDSLIEDVK